MKKIIDIPDSIVKELKIMAVKNDTDLKNYIQDLISRHYEFSNITEMASRGLEDRQSIRFIYDYILQTYEGIRGETFDFGSFKVDTLAEFLDTIICACEMAKKSIDDSEDY